MFSIDGSKMWVAGHGGMVGSALLIRLGQENCEVVDDYLHSHFAQNM